MKKNLFMVMMFFSISAISYANNEKPTTLKSNSTKPECCITATGSATTTTEDCNGYPVTITITEQAKRCHDDCAKAYSMATGAATVQASISVAAATLMFNDCP